MRKKKKKKWGGGGLALRVSCRGKLARSRDLVIGPVTRHKRVAAALPGNTAANHNITQKGGGDKSRKNMDGNKLLKVRKRCNVTCAQADVIWPYQRNTAKCSQETLAQSPGDEAAEASIAPGVGLQGKLLRLERLALLKQNREEWPGEASRPQQKGPGLFPPAMKRKKNDWEDRGKWEQQQISALASLFVRQQRAYDISASFTAGWSEVSSGTSVLPPHALFCSQSHHEDGLPRYKDLIFFFFSLY